MKIKEEFIPLIMDGSKKYEFRNSIDKEGIYKIKDRVIRIQKLNMLKYINILNKGRKSKKRRYSMKLKVFFRR